MRLPSAIIALVLLAGASLGAADAPPAKGNPNALLGAADFLPTPQRPIGWRGDWTGHYPGATPPLQWSRRVNGITTTLRYQARKPVMSEWPRATGAGAELKTSQPLEYFTIKDWLVAGPFSAGDAKAGMEQDFLGGEAAVQPNEGDKAGAVAWKFVRVGMDNQTTHIHNGGMIGNLNIDYVYAFGTFTRDAKTQNFKIEGDLANKVAYAHTYIYAPTAGKVNLTDYNWGAGAKAWLNGQPVPVVVETQQNTWSKKEIEVSLVQGWNRLLIKVASGDNPTKDGNDTISRWRSAVYLAPPPPLSYQTTNIAWMTRMTGRSMSQPIVIGDRIFLGSGISDLMCISKTDGKILWLHSNTPWDALSPEDRAPFKDQIEALATQLERMNEEVVTAINAQVSAQGMATDQQAAMDKKLKDKSELETKIHKAFEKTDGKRFPPMTGNEVASGNATPCSDGSRIYWACGGGMKGPGASVVCCFDLAGKRIWSHHEAFGAAEHGLHTSPLLIDGKLIYGANRILIAFDALTGKVAWKQSCEEFCGSSPLPVKIGNETAILSKSHATLNRVSDGTKFASFDCGGFGDETPVVDNGVMFIPDRFKGWSDANVAFTALQLPTAIADKAPIKSAFELNWEQNHVPLRGISYWVASPLALDGMVYALDMSGGLMAVDVKAQKTVYRRWLDAYCRYHRFLYGYVASPTLGGKDIFITDDSGYTIILKPGATYEEIGRNVIEEVTPASWSGNPCHLEPFYTAPVFSGDTILLRGEEYLYAIRGK